MEEFPSEIDTTKITGFVSVARDKLSFTYSGKGNHAQDVGSVRTDRPIPSHCSHFYFELAVQDAGENCTVTIGLADKSFLLNKQPGTTHRSYGYRGSDGRSFHASQVGNEYGPTFSTGDIVGCGISFVKQEVFFTKNGVDLGVAFRKVRDTLYPTVGLHSRGEKVYLNLGQEPFKFDLQDMIAAEEEAASLKLQKVHVSDPAVQRLVRDYLLYLGYAQTLQALDNAIGASSSTFEPTNVVASSTEESSMEARAGASETKENPNPNPHSTSEVMEVERRTVLEDLILAGAARYRAARMISSPHGDTAGPTYTRNALLPLTHGQVVLMTGRTARTAARTHSQPSVHNSTSPFPLDTDNKDEEDDDSERVHDEQDSDDTPRFFSPRDAEAPTGTDGPLGASPRKYGQKTAIPIWSVLCDTRDSNTWSSLQLRSAVREHILKGRICEAIEVCEKEEPGIILANPDLKLQLYCLRFINFIAANDTLGAIGCAREEIYPLCEGLGYLRTRSDPILERKTPTEKPGPRLYQRPNVMKGWNPLAESIASVYSGQKRNRQDLESSVNVSSSDSVSGGKRHSTDALHPHMTPPDAEQKERIIPEVVEQALGLLAYYDPRSSPLSHLLTPAHAEKVADDVNQALLGDSKRRYNTALHVLCAQLVATKQLSRELSGNKGPVFELCPGDVMDVQHVNWHPNGSG